MVEVVLSHWGLATAALVHGVLTLVTGVALTAERYGYPPGPQWRGILRVGHTTLGILWLFYLVATYLVVPV